MTVVKTIGVGAGLNITPDYTDINSWDSYMNALGTFTEDQVARVLWASSANELFLSVAQVLDGSTPSTFQIILEAGDADGNAGGSFRDNTNKATNELRYNVNNGACYRGHVGTNILGLLDPNITLRYLQVRKSHNYNHIINMLSADAGRVIDSCIFEQDTTGAISGLLLSQNAVTIQNCLWMLKATSSSTGVYALSTGNSGTMTVNDCTIVCTDAGISASFALRASAADQTVNAKNVAIYGWGDDLTMGGGTFNGSYCATDLSSAASHLTGTNHQFDVIGATEWESVTNGSEDFRLKSTSVKCKDNGTSSGTPTTDIINQSRSGNYDIGAWEFQGAHTPETWGVVIRLGA